MADNNTYVPDKHARCRYGTYDLGGKRGLICLHDNFANGDVTTLEKCESCPKFKSRYIEFPISVNNIIVDEEKLDGGLYKSIVGNFVKVRPCGDEYKGKTFIGIMLGEMPMCVHASYDEDDRDLHIGTISNPAIFVPALKRVVFGCESWWERIKNEDIESEVVKHPITDDAIQNQWYVQMAQLLSKAVADTKGKEASASSDTDKPDEQPKEPADNSADDDEGSITVDNFVSEPLRRFAESINGHDAFATPFLSQKERQIAKHNRFVVMYGCSDDLLELEGALFDEFGAYEGTHIYFAPDGSYIQDQSQNPPVNRNKYPWYAKLMWCEESSAYSWTFDTNIPHAEIEVTDGGSRYCRAIVFDLNDLAAGKESRHD